MFQVTAKKTANTLLRNFYVADVLKSVLSVRDTLTLIQEVTDLCTMIPENICQKLDAWESSVKGL